MPSAKTQTTEVSIGFGLLGKNPQSTPIDQIGSLFENTLSSGEFASFLTEFLSNPAYYERFVAIGQHLRHTRAEFENMFSLQWAGPRRQAGTISVPQDLVAAGMPISVKANSNIVRNSSVHGLFISLPEGRNRPSRTPNWFLKIAPEEYQHLYGFALRVIGRSPYPKTVDMFHRFVKGDKNKRAFSILIDSFSNEQRAEFNRRYKKLNNKVAEISAKLFNQKIKESLTSNIRSSIFENILREFFRVGGARYILCGFDNTNEFALYIPDLTAVTRNWKISDIYAQPDLDSRQCLVRIFIMLENGSEKVKLPFRVVIRWSRRKFVGNPEAKLHREFEWKQVPFFKTLYSEDTTERIEIIGESSFGIVYRAAHKSMGDKIAVKEFHKTFATQEDDLLRFIQEEIRLMSELDHPNILPILQYELEGQSPWFAIPLAEGSVGDIIKSLTGDFPRINHIFLQALEGMAYAHSKGVMHRDLKPKNLLLFENDLVRIGDFGLGKQLNLPEDQGITVVGMNVIGAMAYAAPEQLEDLEVDFRADVYALGKTFIHMATGIPPLHGPRLIKRIPERFQDFIEKSIQDNPKDRYQSVLEMLSAFKSIN